MNEKALVSALRIAVEGEGKRLVIFTGNGTKAKVKTHIRIRATAIIC